MRLYRAEGFYKSPTGGKTFTVFRTPHGDNHDIWISPKDGNIIIQSNDGGAKHSFDGRRTWSSQLNHDGRNLRRLVWTINFLTSFTERSRTTRPSLFSASPTRRIVKNGVPGPGCETGPIILIRKTRTSSMDPAKVSMAYEFEAGQEKNYWVGAQSLYGNPATDLDSAISAGLANGDFADDPEVLY